VARIDQTPFETEITGLTHDGRGVARRENGKAVFVAGALPGERVHAVRGVADQRQPVAGDRRQLQKLQRKAGRRGERRLGRLLATLPGLRPRHHLLPLRRVWPARFAPPPKGLFALRPRPGR